MKRSKLFVATGILLALIAIVGCEDSATSSARETISVESSDDLQNCKEEDKGTVAIVESTNCMYFCNGDMWVEMRSKDTLYIKPDTLVVKDSVKVLSIDTVYSYDTLIVNDTIHGTDTLFVYDSTYRARVDTIYVKDSLVLAGLDGNSCSMASEIDTVNAVSGASGYKVYCADTLQTVLWNGTNGEDGKNCIVKSYSQYSLIECGMTQAVVRNGSDGESCSLTDDKNGTVVITCGSTQTTVYKGLCGKTPYDPFYSNYFCSYGKLYSKCSGEEYDPSTQFCYGSSLYKKCHGVTSYNPKSFQCVNGVASSTFTVKDVNGHSYKAVAIGTQVWLNRNLQTDPPERESRCYNDEIYDYYNPPECWPYNSRLYTWTVAVDTVALMEKYQIDCSSEKKCNIPDSIMVQGICPDGWHIPSAKEFQTLIFTVAGDATEATRILQNGVYYQTELIESKETFGFELRGNGFYGDGKYQWGDYVFLWSSTDAGSAANSLRVFSGPIEIANSSKSLGYAVRCIRDTDSMK
ncbi:FISUMP domain-containing protein [Fibrobacter sp.]|uniref:FISUMP domain-containing protein n=1 Tax=Fibrobacter sp. TaxID=35828 RepID=UPI00388EE166